MMNGSRLKKGKRTKGNIIKDVRNLFRLKKKNIIPQLKV